MITKQEKSAIINSQINDFSTMKAAVLVDFTGVKVSQIDILRKNARKSNVQFKVIKNSLAKKALRGSKAESLINYFEGATAVGYSISSPVDPARVMYNYAQENQNFKIKIGFLEDKILSYDVIKALAELPSREVLIAKLLGTLNAPITNFVNVLAGIPRKLVYALAAVRDMKDKNK